MINPATGEIVGTVPRGARGRRRRGRRRAARVRVLAAHSTRSSARARLALADAVAEHAEELALLDVAENGSPIREMRGDAHKAAAQLRYFAGLALQLRGETIPGDADRLNYTLMQPFGVVGRIVPFNHPLMFAAGKIAAPLIAGNTVVVKPSEHTSTSALRLAELATRGVPAGRGQRHHRLWR